MNKFIAKIFKSAGVDAKVSKDSEHPRFKVVENKLTLEGVIRDGKYSMTIKDNRGRKIDNLTVSIGNSNDVVNRINESINTLKMLSTAYDAKKLVEEDEEFDTVIADEEEPQSLIDGLTDLYNKIMDTADWADGLVDIADSEDAEQLNDIIAFTSSLYDVAIDVDEYIEDLTPDMEEGYKRKKQTKLGVQNAINNLTMVEAIVRKERDMSDILTAIKDIKSELILRSR